jgi:hypothetical protein
MHIVYFRMARPVHAYEAALSLKFRMWKIGRNACWALSPEHARNAQKKKRQRW